MVRFCCCYCRPRIVAPVDHWDAVHSRRSAKKRGFCAGAGPTKIGLRRIATEPRFMRNAKCSASAAEEQPQQNDHRNWHAQQPQQKSFSHRILLNVKSRSKRAMGCRVPARLDTKRPRREGTFYDVGISASDDSNSEGPSRSTAYQWPVFGIDDHGSAGGFGSPFCNSSIECRSGERTKAMLPSRGGRLMVTPAFISRSQVA